MILKIVQYQILILNSHSTNNSDNGTDFNRQECGQLICSLYASFVNSKSKITRTLLNVLIFQFIIELSAYGLESEFIDIISNNICSQLMTSFEENKSFNYKVNKFFSNLRSHVYSSQDIIQFLSTVSLELLLLCRPQEFQKAFITQFTAEAANRDKNGNVIFPCQLGTSINLNFSLNQFLNNQDIFIEVIYIM